MKWKEPPWADKTPPRGGRGGDLEVDAVYAGVWPPEAPASDLSL